MVRQAEVLWSAPSPILQSGKGLDLEDFRRPAILRLKGDSFMEDFLNLLEVDPSAMTRLLAENESWIEPMDAPAALTARKNSLPFSKATAKAIAKPPPSLKPQAEGLLKLYQPVHQHYYLVAASLLCPPSGIRDHTLCQGCEKVHFVIRRLIRTKTGKSDSETTEEFAFVANANGKGWRKLGAFDPEITDASPGEDKLPLFPSFFEQDWLGEQNRRVLWNGLIPAGRKEEYATAPELIESATGGGSNAAQPAPIGTERTAFKVLFRMQVTEPWKALIDNSKNQSRIPQPAFDAESGLNDAQKTELHDAQKAAAILRLQDLQVNSWYILLDFQQFLSKYLPRVWGKMAGLPEAVSLVLNPAEQELVNTLKAIALDWEDIIVDAAGEFWSSHGYSKTLHDALVGIAISAEKLENNTGTLAKKHSEDDWDLAKFPLVAPYGPSMNSVDYKSTLRLNGTVLMSTALPLDENKEPISQTSVDYLVVLVEKAFPAENAYKKPIIPDAAQAPLSRNEPIFIIRFVFQKTDCKPMHDARLSRASRPFTLAGFFDPEAPMRPVKIAMPFNPSVAGLRKFHKNATFVISNTMCGFKQTAASLTFMDLVLSVLPWPFHRDLPSAGPTECKTTDSFGLLCTLSIPIITICAFILLIIMVMLLDIIFKWIPYFIFCFPIPGLKKKEAG